MKTIRTHHLTRKLCLVLIAVMTLSLAPMGLGLAQTPAKTVLVFPLANAIEGAPASLGDTAANAIALAIGDLPGMEATPFLSTSPSVRRAVSEGRVREVDVEEANRDLGTCLMIGNALRADYVVIGNVQSLVQREGPVGVDVIVSGQMYDVQSNLSPDSGEAVPEPKVFRAFGVSGSSVGRARYTGSNDTLVLEALRDAAGKAAQAISGRVVETGTPSSKRVSSGYKWVILALLVGGLMLAVNGSGGGSEKAPAADAYPPTGLTLEIQDAALALSWQEPTGTTLTVLRYQVWRSVDGGSFARVDPGNLGAGSTSYTDYNTVSGDHTYQYRVRVIYTSGDTSPYATSGAVRASF